MKQLFAIDRKQKWRDSKQHIVVLNKTTADMVDVWHICILLQHYLAIYTTPLSMVVTTEICL